jgi:hypothetical protein
MPKESPSQQRKVKKVMHEYKHGELKSGGRGKSRPKVKSRKQAIAIALSEAKVPPRKGDTRAKKKKTTASGKSSPRKTTRTKATTTKRKTTAKRAPARRRAGAQKTKRQATARKSRQT